MATTWLILSGILILVGLAGTVLPLLPGPPVALAGLIILGVASHFEKVGAVAISVFSALTLLTILFDFIGPALGAKKYKSTKYGVYGAVIGAILGVLVGGPIGAFVGPFIGALIGELVFSQKEANSAFKSAWGAFVGFLVSTMFKLAVTLAMAVYFIFALFN
ncbi:MAG: DUF456 domain-containing protein [Candidatus Doudnabacteria bacterium]|nr:DUF456 domain-containing protein [Candidatus Doudnabacteria bacterium]